MFLDTTLEEGEATAFSKLSLPCDSWKPGSRAGLCDEYGGEQCKQVANTLSELVVEGSS